MDDYYRSDLARIHDLGFGDVAEGAARLLLAELAHAGLLRGTVVDLGCGGGQLTRRVVDAGYTALGVDTSAAFLEIARRRVPEAELHLGSCLSVALPPCVAIAAVGEVLSYTFDEGNGSQARADLFRRAWPALSPGGLLVFDVAVRGRARPSGVTRASREGPDWAVMAASEVDATGRMLTRRITSFVREGALYRRDSETHRLELEDPDWVLASLRAAGFEARTLASYGTEALPAGVVAFLARKPARA